MLAGKPTSDVDAIVAALKQARLDAVAEERERRAKRRAERSRLSRDDDDKLSNALEILTRSLAGRAGFNVDALELFAKHADLVHRLTAQAVEAARGNGWSDPQIAAALGVSRNAIGQTYGRKQAREGGDQR
jgi:hypothetical protein